MKKIIYKQETKDEKGYPLIREQPYHHLILIIIPEEY